MIYAPQEYDIAADIIAAGIVKRGRGVRKKEKERDFVNMVSAFDIETSKIMTTNPETGEQRPHSFMYIWQWQFDATVTIVGRTWEEFTALCQTIKEACTALGEKKHTPETPLLVVYVHNLAYEFQFLRGVYDFSNDECFFREPRKPIYCRMYDCIELRCSYLQSNMSLAKFAEKMGATVHKESGQKFDYSKVRFPWTELTPEELRYCVADVECLREAIQLELIKDGDTLKTIPLTSTGYVRRDCKKACYPVRPMIKAMAPDIEQYKLLRAAFRGGNTHANRFFTGKILENVESVDMTSCYPAQQLTKDFPISPFKWLDPPSMDRVETMINLGRAVVGLYAFDKLKLRNPEEPIPYLSLSKCDAFGLDMDNGRIKSALYCETALTEIDLQIVRETYEFEGIKCLKAMVAQKGPLPGVYREQIQIYYNRKTELKGLDDDDSQYRLMKAKNLLNGIYGMSAQDPIHMSIEYNGGEYKTSDYTSEDALKQLKKAPFPYQWGVYTTAHARAALQEGIKRAGEKIVYCDTDSVKTLGHVSFKGINTKRQKAAERVGAYADDIKGGRHYVGVFEVDGLYKRFITQGAKRYAYETEKNGKIKMGVTVSGVTHKINELTGLPYAVEELGQLENFKPGMTWYKAGGTAAVYNDNDDFNYKDPATGRTVRITSNVSIVNSTYDLEYSKDYDALLQRLVLYTEYKKRTE